MLPVNGIVFSSGALFLGVWLLLEIFPLETVFPNIDSMGAQVIGVSLLFILLIGGYTMISVTLSGMNPILLILFYRRRFTPMGYLTFTRPVKASHDFLAALTVILFWNVVAFFALFLAFALHPLAYGTDFSVCWAYYSDMFVHSPSRILDADEWLQLLSVVSVFLYRTVAGVTAVVIAGNYLRRAKAVGTIALYAAFRLPVMILMFVTYLSRSAQHVPVADTLPYFGFMYLLSSVTNDLYPICSIILLALTIVGCLLSIHIMKKRLNLA